MRRTQTTVSARKVSCQRVTAPWKITYILRNNSRRIHKETLGHQEHLLISQVSSRRVDVHDPTSGHTMSPSVHSVTALSGMMTRALHLSRPFRRLHTCGRSKGSWWKTVLVSSKPAWSTQGNPVQKTQNKATSILQPEAPSSGKQAKSISRPGIRLVKSANIKTLRCKLIPATPARLSRSAGRGGQIEEKLHSHTSSSHGLQILWGTLPVPRKVDPEAKGLECP